MIKFEFHYGAEQIGGTKIVLQSGKSRILIDFGIDLNKVNWHYHFPLFQPSVESDYIEIEELPEVEEFYAIPWDVAPQQVREALKKVKAEKDIFTYDEQMKKLRREVKKSLRRAIHAVVVSHPHIDHWGHIFDLEETTDIFLGKGTKVLIDAYISSTNKSAKEIMNVQRRLGSATTIEPNKKIAVADGIEVEFIPVDHSCPDAYGLIIYTDNKKIAYSGDLRAHGPRSELTEHFIKRLSEERIDVFLCEGTHIEESEWLSEDDVRQKLEEIFRIAEGMVFVDTSRMDLDRFNSIYDSVKAANRKYGISLKRAWMFHKIKESGINLGCNIPNLKNDNEIFIFAHRDPYYPWEKEIVREYRGKIKNPKEVGTMKEKIVLDFNYFSLQSLDRHGDFGLKPPEGSLYVIARTEPWDELGEVDLEKLKNWLNIYGLPMINIHSSGHLSALDLKELMKRVRPKILIPIHTDHPRLFKQFLGYYAEEIRVVRNGEELEIK